MNNLFARLVKGSPLRTLAVLFCAGCLVSTSHAASNVTLSDQNSTATINLGNGSGALGMNGWVLNGPQGAFNQLAQQWFWLRVGDSTGQTPINGLSAPNIVYQDPTTLSVT